MAYSMAGSGCSLLNAEASLNKFAASTPRNTSTTENSQFAVTIVSPRGAGFCGLAPAGSGEASWVAVGSEDTDVSSDGAGVEAVLPQASIDRINRMNAGYR